MPRLLLTFKTLHRVMSAEKTLRSENSIKCRVTPIPAGLGDSVCGMAVEVLNLQEKAAALAVLDASELKPSGVHEIS